METKEIKQKFGYDFKDLENDFYNEIDKIFKKYKINLKGYDKDAFLHKIWNEKENYMCAKEILQKKIDRYGN